MHQPRTSDLTRRLLRLRASATPDDVAAGVEWYGRANGLAFKLAAQYGVTPRQAASVIAVLSPTNRWHRNVQDAEAMLAWHASGRIGDPPSVCTYGPNRVKAIRIMDGDLGALSGPKVEAFAANILGDHEYVTLDIWACRAALGDDKATGPGRHRQKIARAYRNAAARSGDTPAAFQAIVWTVIRGKAD